MEGFLDAVSGCENDTASKAFRSGSNSPSARHLTHRFLL
jgi:hypothetical protein